MTRRWQERRKLMRRVASRRLPLHALRSSKPLLASSVKATRFGPDWPRGTPSDKSAQVVFSRHAPFNRCCWLDLGEFPDLTTPRLRIVARHSPNTPSDAVHSSDGINSRSTRAGNADAPVAHRAGGSISSSAESASRAGADCSEATKNSAESTSATAISTPRPGRAVPDSRPATT